MILSVITSHYNRLVALSRLLNLKKEYKNNDVEFIVIDWPNGKGIFSTAWCHNQAVRKAKGKWILKQDVDCICESEMYDRILHLIKFRDYKWFSNFGCLGYVRAGDVGYPTGNQYLCSKRAFLEVGEEPEFYGYGCEDYALLYKLFKLQSPKLKLEYNENNVDAVIRDDLARPLNRLYQDIYFTHFDHERQPKEMRELYLENRKKLYQICKEMDSPEFERKVYQGIDGLWYKYFPGTLYHGDIVKND